MKRIGIFIFDDCDLLDVGGPYEVFLTADRLSQREGGGKIFEVTTVSTNGQTVSSFGGMGLTPHQALSDDHGFDVVVIPGAINIDDVASRQDIQHAVETLCRTPTIVSSVCTGAFLLGDLGFLNNLAWTTHFEDVDDLGKRINSSDGHKLVRWVDTGRVVTAGGLSSGIAMALHLVSRLAGLDLATATANQLEYAWHPTTHDH